MSQRHNVKFSSDGNAHWEVHWPAQLVATGDETARSNGATPGPGATAGVSLHQLDNLLLSLEFNPTD